MTSVDPAWSPAVAELRALRTFTGPPPEFWGRYLAALGALTGARSAQMLHPDATGERVRWRRLAQWPAGSPPAPLPAGVEAALDSAQTAAAGTVTTGDFTLARLETGDARQTALVALEAPHAAVAPALALAADVPASYLESRRHALQQRDTSIFAATLDLLLLLQEQTRFFPAAALVCNELAARVSADRVSLGWLHNHQARVAAMSHTDKFDRKTEPVRLLELAMEECADQDEEIVCPPDDDARQVRRDHGNYRRAQECGHLASVPLRAGGETVGVLTAERRTAPFGEDDLANLRVAADQIAPRLAELRSAERGIVRQSLERTRRRLARWAGPTHTWWKAGGLLAALALLFLLLGRLPHRVSAPFLVRSAQVAHLTAPFDAFLFDAAVEPGDEVEAGAVLCRFDTRDLLLEEAVAQANLVRHEREIERTRATNALAEMRIAEALAEQARATLDQTRQRLARAEVVAPFAGVVVAADLKERLGAPVRAGEVVAQVARLDTLFFELQVPEADIHHVRPGAAVRVAFASQPDVRFDAVVERIEPAAEATPTGAAFLVRCRADAARAPWWRPGMGGIAKVEAGWRSPLWLLTHRTVNWFRLRFWWW